MPTYHNAKGRESLMELLQSREESLFQGSTSWCKRLENLAVDVQHYEQTEMSA